MFPFSPDSENKAPQILHPTNTPNPIRSIRAAVMALVLSTCGVWAGPSTGKSGGEITKFSEQAMLSDEEIALLGTESQMPGIFQREFNMIKQYLRKSPYKFGIIHADYRPIGSVIPSPFEGAEVRMGENTIVVREREGGKYMQIVGINGLIEHWARSGYSPEKFPFFLNASELGEETGVIPGDIEMKENFAAFLGENEKDKNWVELLFGTSGNNKGIEGGLREILERGMQDIKSATALQTHLSWFYELLQQSDQPFNLIPRHIIGMPEVTGDVYCITFLDGDCYHKISVPRSDAFREKYLNGATPEYIRNIRLASSYPQYVAVGHEGLSDVEVGTIRLPAGPRDLVIDEICFDVLETGNILSHGIRSVSVGGQKVAVIDGKATIRGINIPVSADQIFADVPVRVDYSGIGEGMVPSGTSPFLTVSGIGYDAGGVRYYDKSFFPPGALNTTQNTLVCSLPHVSIRAPESPSFSVGGYAHVVNIDVSATPTGDIGLSQFGITLREHGITIDKTKPPILYLNGARIELDENNSTWHAHNLRFNIAGKNEKTSLGKILFPAGTINTIQILLPVGGIIESDGHLEIGLYDPSTHSSVFGWYDESSTESSRIHGAGHGTPTLPDFPLEKVRTR